jgi:hypothetical protein
MDAETADGARNYSSYVALPGKADPRRRYKSEPFMLFLAVVYNRMRSTATFLKAGFQAGGSATSVISTVAEQGFAG